MFHVEYRSGYFHIWLERKLNRELAKSLDKESVYALNTLVCQLFEIYNNYPNAFKCFELNDKGDIENERRTKQTTNDGERKPFRQRRKMGLSSLMEKIDFEEN